MKFGVQLHYWRKKKMKKILFSVLVFLLLGCGVPDQVQLTEEAIEECATGCFEDGCGGFIFIFQADPELQCNCLSCP